MVSVQFRILVGLWKQHCPSWSALPRPPCLEKATWDDGTWWILAHHRLKKLSAPSITTTQPPSPSVAPLLQVQVLSTPKPRLYPALQFNPGRNRGTYIHKHLDNWAAAVSRNATTTPVSLTPTRQTTLYWANLSWFRTRRGSSTQPDAPAMVCVRRSWPRSPAAVPHPRAFLLGSHGEKITEVLLNTVHQTGHTGYPSVSVQLWATNVFTNAMKLEFFLFKNLFHFRKNVPNPKRALRIPPAGISWELWRVIWDFVDYSLFQQSCYCYRLLCTVCKRDFRSLPALNGHMRSHSGIRSACMSKVGAPHECAQCVKCCPLWLFWGIAVFFPTEWGPLSFTLHLHSDARQRARPLQRTSS